MQYFVHLIGLKIRWEEWTRERSALRNRFNTKFKKKRKPFTIQDIINYALFYDCTVKNAWNIDLDILVKVMTVELYFFCGTRALELIASNRLGVKKGLSFCHIKWYDYIQYKKDGKTKKRKHSSYWHFRVIRHKTYKYIGPKDIYLGCTRHPIVDPAKKLFIYLKRISRKLQCGDLDRVLRFKNGRALSYDYLLKLTKEVVNINKLQGYYGSHSFRIGLCTALLIRKAPRTLVAMIGHWSMGVVSCMDIYMRPQLMQMIRYPYWLMNTKSVLNDIYFPKW